MPLASAQLRSPHADVPYYPELGGNMLAVGFPDIGLQCFSPKLARVKWGRWRTAVLFDQMNNQLFPCAVVNGNGKVLRNHSPKVVEGESQAPNPLDAWGIKP